MKTTNGRCQYCLFKTNRIFWALFGASWELEKHLIEKHGFTMEQIEQLCKSNRPPIDVFNAEIETSMVECHSRTSCYLNTPVEIPENLVNGFVNNHQLDFKHLVVVKAKDKPPTYGVRAESPEERRRLAVKRELERFKAKWGNFFGINYDGE